MIAIFVRYDHPPGYGMPAGPGEQMRAHGYSVVFVRCSTAREILDVRKKMLMEGLPEPLGHTYHWYGGKGWDHAGTVLDGDRLEFAGGGYGKGRIGVGDNRFVGVYDAAELLEEIEQHHEHRWIPDVNSGSCVCQCGAACGCAPGEACKR